ncbi:MAG: hypothetical protein Q7S43_01710 [bacterium]|nr:hypothetical protein [bacterium]
MKTIVKTYSNGDKKIIKLGEEQTCCSAEPRGWGTSCETLTLKSDGFYHCKDCGLAFKKLDPRNIPSVIAIKCDCKELINFLEWYFDECFGYDCPINYYKCAECERVYKAPHYSHEAPLRFQESEVARKHVKRRLADKRKRQEEIKDKIKTTIKELQKELGLIPKSERIKFLNELRHK